MLRETTAFLIVAFCVFAIAKAYHRHEITNSKHFKEVARFDQIGIFLLTSNKK